MENIAILTAFREFVPGYSLTGICLDQAALLSQAGHRVDIFVCEDFCQQSPLDFPYWVSGAILKEVPAADLTDYHQRHGRMSMDHVLVSQKMGDFCKRLQKEYPIILTHDLILTGWNLPYGQGIKGIAKEMPDTRWLHWIHSIPCGMRDYWSHGELGKKHRIVYPNKTDAGTVAAQFRTEEEMVLCIPHPKDLRSWFDFSYEAWEFIKEFPAVMQADVVQIYPASTDRLEAKRVKELLQIFAEIKREGNSVCLVIANQWATGKQRKEDITRYMALAKRYGLSGDEVIFTSNWMEGEYEKGLPKRVLRELFQCSNLFVFPTREETFGLVMPEAVLAGGVLPVLNKSLSMMAEVSGMNALYVDFGSFFQVVVHPDERNWIKTLVHTIMSRMRRSEAITTKTFVRQSYNWEVLYNKFYGPVFAESILW